MRFIDDRTWELQRLYNLAQSQTLETVQVRVNVRARWKRALLHGMALADCTPNELERIRVALS